MKTYEGMFLIDSKEAKKGSEAIEETIKGLIEKCKGRLVRFEKWDERRLAYEIDGVINGTYYLYYFTGETDTIATLNREVQLSSKVLRALFLRIKEVPEFIECKPSEESDEDEGRNSSHDDAGDNEDKTDSDSTGNVVADNGDDNAEEEGNDEESDGDEPEEEDSTDDTVDSEKPEN